MKYSNYIGIAAALALVAFCYMPWIYIESIKTTITGLDTAHTNFGRPGIMHIMFAVLSTIFFLIQQVWAKRTNLFIVTFNFAWAIRNFFFITQCEMGECPEKKPGIYAVLVLSSLIFLMGLLPKMTVKD